MGYGCEVGSTIVYVGPSEKLVTYPNVEDYFTHAFDKEFARIRREDPILILGLRLREHTWADNELPFTYLLVDHLALLDGRRNTLITNVTGIDPAKAAKEYFARNFAPLTG